MKKKIPSGNAFEKIRKDLRHFIDLSIENNDLSWQNWVLSVYEKKEAKCWITKDCQEQNCPAYRNECGRCWLIAGTMCSCEVKGKYSQVYSSCKECEIYIESVYQTPLSEVEEHLVILVHSLRTKQKELKELATTDFLTEVYNRRYFDLFMETKIEELKRSDNRLFLVLIDVNDFKKINDQRGHLYGDYVLKECADILLDATRRSDVIVRFGGDELLVIAQDDQKNDHTAANLITRVETRVAAWNQSHKEEGVVLALSYGVSVVTGKTDLQSALREADNNMYKDKQSKKKNTLPRIPEEG